MFRFERLDIWLKSIDYANMVYKVTDSFPSKEQFGLTSQLRRASVSISANIAESSSRSSDRDFSRYIEIAYGSLCETISDLKIASVQNFISNEDLQSVYRAADELGKMLTAFRNSLGKWKTVVG